MPKLPHKVRARRHRMDTFLALYSVLDKFLDQIEQKTPFKKGVFVLSICKDKAVVFFPYFNIMRAFRARRIVRHVIGDVKLSVF